MGPPINNCSALWATQHWRSCSDLLSASFTPCTPHLSQTVQEILTLFQPSFVSTVPSLPYRNFTQTVDCCQVSAIAYWQGGGTYQSLQYVLCPSPSFLIDVLLARTKDQTEDLASTSQKSKVTYAFPSGSDIKSSSLGLLFAAYSSRPLSVTGRGSWTPTHGPGRTHNHALSVHEKSLRLPGQLLLLVTTSSS
jgi:hypothetical protein